MYESFKKHTMEASCAVYYVSRLIGKKWTLLILLGLESRKRYSELKRSLPHITPKMLSARLHTLEKEGLIRKRISTKTTPPTCSYACTQQGKQLIRLVRRMKKWSLRWKGNSFCSHL